MALDDLNFGTDANTDTSGPTTPTAASTLSQSEDEDRNRGKHCFVIMPFGVKEHPFTQESIDFDRVYEEIICEALRGILPSTNYKRADSSTAAGLIHHEMIDDIISRDIAIVDITTANPNVMYELGVRHTAKRSGTVVIKKEGDRIPFNIGGIRAFEYPDFSDPAAIKDFIRVLKATILNALDGGTIDSLVHGLHSGLNVTRRPRQLKRRQTYVYPCEANQETTVNDRELCVVTGDIAAVTDIDIWVNPENTAMQMSRFYDDSVSATIRYYGAERDSNGFVRRDTISNELKSAMANLPVAQPGTVVETSSGALLQSNEVRRILHVAAQYGEPSKGYLTVRNSAGCVENCLRKADHMNRALTKGLRKREVYDSILFPLFGVRAGDGRPEQVTRDLMEAVVRYFEKHTDSLIERVYFLAYTDVDKALCEQGLKWLGFNNCAIEPKRKRARKKSR